MWTELDLAMEGLRRSRVIDKGEKRERLPASDELQALTTYFYQQWCDYPSSSRLPQMQQVTLHSDWQMLQRYVNMGTRSRLQRLDFAEAMRVASGGKFQAA